MSWFFKKEKFNEKYYIINTKDDFDTLVTRRKQLAYDLWAIRKNCLDSGRFNYYAITFLITLSVASSSIAGIMGLMKFDSTTIGLIAFGPTVASLIANAFKFQEKANWFYRRKDIIDTLYNKFSFEGPAPTDESVISALKHIEEISQQWSTENQTMSSGWEKVFEVKRL